MSRSRVFIIHLTWIHVVTLYLPTFPCFCSFLDSIYPSSLFPCLCLYPSLFLYPFPCLSHCPFLYPSLSSSHDHGFCCDDDRDRDYDLDPGYDSSDAHDFCSYTNNYTVDNLPILPHCPKQAPKYPLPDLFCSFCVIIHNCIACWLKTLPNGLFLQFR